MNLHWLQKYCSKSLKCRCGGEINQCLTTSLTLLITMKRNAFIFWSIFIIVQQAASSQVGYFSH